MSDTRKSREATDGTSRQNEERFEDDFRSLIGFRSLIRF
jgi:hypothetical protein